MHWQGRDAEEFMKVADDVEKGLREREGEDERKKGGAVTARAYAIKEAEGFVKVYEDIKKLRNDFVDIKIENSAYRAMVGSTEWFAVVVGGSSLPSAFFRTRRSAENWAREVNSLSPADYKIISFNTTCAPFKVGER